MEAPAPAFRTTAPYGREIGGFDERRENICTQVSRISCRIFTYYYYGYART